MKKSFTVIKELQERSRKCHEFVRGSFLSEKIENATLQKALKHYFSYWNDFTHPGLFSVAYEAVGGEPDEALQPQAAIAMVAAGFDIHDDIIDKSAEKYDHPTVFGKFGPDLTLLLGNAFAIKGLTLLGQSILNLPRGKATEILGIIKTCLFEVGNAHAIELGMKSDAETSTERYLQVIHMKAASIEADMQIGAILGKGTAKEIKALKECGRTLGLLTQLREEFIDIFEVEELRHRLHNEYPPIPLLYLLQDAKSKETIVKTLTKKKMGTGDLDKLVDMVFKAESVRELRKRMKKLVDGSIQSTSKLRKSESKHMLQELAASMLEDL
jgi:geranylgeranyl pyrophosphate synthase